MVLTQDNGSKAWRCVVESADVIECGDVSLKSTTPACRRQRELGCLPLTLESIPPFASDTAIATDFAHDSVLKSEPLDRGWRHRTTTRLDRSALAKKCLECNDCEENDIDEGCRFSWKHDELPQVEPVLLTPRSEVHATSVQDYVSHPLWNLGARLRQEVLCRGQKHNVAERLAQFIDRSFPGSGAVDRDRLRIFSDELSFGISHEKIARCADQDNLTSLSTRLGLSSLFSLSSSCGTSAVVSAIDDISDLPASPEEVREWNSRMGEKELVVAKANLKSALPTFSVGDIIELSDDVQNDMGFLHKGLRVGFSR